MGNTSGKPHHRSRTKKQVRWKAADRPLPPGRPQLIPDAYPAPDVITIRWNPPKSDGGSPITGYLVEHRRCGSPHWVRATPLLVRFPEVSLSGLEPGWRYQFRVSAENAVGLSMPSEISEPLTVTLQRSAITAPRFTEELQDTVALENEKTEFVVHYMGQPSPKVSWFKDGFEIFSSRRTRIITENDKSILTIHQTALSDEGEIKCTATNRAGHASTRALLKLEAPPSIRLPRQYEEGLLFEIGEVIRLKVSIAGRPTPLVFWFHNSESLKSDERYEIESTDRFSSLKINEARRADRGEYQVRAVNKLGEDNSSFLVTVTDKPSPPGRARVVMTLGRSITLSWKTPEDDGGCKIGNYIVEYYRIGWNVWLKAATCRQLTTVLGDLIEGSEYKFRVKAESPYGISEPSEESETVFIPDPKRGLMAPRTRAKSQPPDLLPSDYISISYEPKVEPQPRSRSGSRTEKHVTISEITDMIPPVRPRRTKSKSAPQTPLPSPAVGRRLVNTSTIDKGIFDRSSMARELAYGSPGMKSRRVEETPNNRDTRTESPNLRSRAVEASTQLHYSNVTERPKSPPIIVQENQRSQSPPQINHRPTSPTGVPQNQRHQSPNQVNYKHISPPMGIQQSQRPQSLTQVDQRLMSPPREIQQSHSPTHVNQRPTSPPGGIQQNQRPQSPTQINFRSISPFRGIQQNQRPESPAQVNPIPTSSGIQQSKQIILPTPADTRDRTTTKIQEDNQKLFSSMKSREDEGQEVMKRDTSNGFSYLKDNLTEQRPMSPVNFHRDRSPSLTNSKEKVKEQNRLKSPSPARELVNTSPSSSNDDFRTQNRHSMVLPKSSGLNAERHLDNNFSSNQLLDSKDSVVNRKDWLRNSKDSSKSPSPEHPLKSPSPERLSPSKLDFPLHLRNRNDYVTGSSEFMLVLLPGEKGEGRGSSSDIRFDFNEISYPPPLSLSAPELGVEQPPIEILRSASSTDILKERQMQRVYEAIVAEETELRKKERDAREELRLDIPKIQINSRDAEVPPLEKNPSFRRRLSGGSLSHHMFLGHRRHSLRNADLTDISENKLHKFELSSDEKRELYKIRQRSESEEMEENEFEKVRQKMTNENKTIRKTQVAIADENAWEESSEASDEQASFSESESSEDERHAEGPAASISLEDEEHTYRPGLMLPTNNQNPHEEPFEILTKRCPLPDPNFVPKPILKRREDDVRYIPEKPIRKDLEQKQRERSQSLLPKASSLDHKQRSSSPRPPQHTNFEKRGSLPAVKLANIPPIPESRMERVSSPERKQSIKTDDEIKAVADHYGDLLKSYGYTKRNVPPIYLDRDELKAAAEEQSNENLEEIEKSVSRLQVPESTVDFSGSDSRNDFQIQERTPRTRTDSTTSDDGDRRVFQRRGSNSLSPGQRRDSNALEQKKGKSGNKSNSRSKGRAPPARQENWSYLRAPPSPQTGRKASPSPQRRTSLSNAQAVTTPTTQRKKLREITTQTSGCDNHYLPYPRVPTPEQEEMLAKAEVSVRTTIDYLTDLAMFFVACWLYLFHNELLAIPVLLVMVYRQLKEEIRKRLPKWMLPKKKRRPSRK